MQAPCTLCDKILQYRVRHAEELVWEFSTSVVFLGPWQFYEGYCIVTARQHLTELFEMCPEDRKTMMDEVTLVAEAIHKVTKPRKINYEWLGNQVPHMHWHLFPRQQSDPNHLQVAWLDISHAEADPEKKKRWQACQRGRSVMIKEIQQALKQLLPSK